MKSLDKLRECRVVFIRDGKSVDPIELADEIQREVDENYAPKPVGYELLPCYFCGSEYTQVRYMGGKWQEPSAFSSGYRGECCDCGATTAAYDTEAEAVAAWNMRAGGYCPFAKPTDLTDGCALLRERMCNLIEDEDVEYLLHCSNCGGGAPKQSWAYWSYCPNCGARVVK